MDKELTDNEIIKALECCCKNNNCEGCPLDYLTFSSQCASELAIKSLDLINRLQEKNSNLSSDLTSLQNDLTSLQAENESWQAAYMTEKQEIANLEIELKAMRGAANSYKAENERLEQNLKEAHIDIKEHLAENERLKKSNEMFADIGKLYSEIKTEAYKEFAERLKAEAK